MTTQYPKGAIWLRRIFYSVAAILFVLLLANILLNIVLENKIKKALDGMDSTMRIEFSTVHASIFSLSCSMKSIQAVYQQDTAGSHQHLFSFDELKIEGVNVFKWWLDDKISARKLILTKGNITLDKYLLTHPDTIHAKPAPGEIQIKNIFIHAVEIKDANMVVHTGTSNEMQWNGDIKIKNLETGNDTNLFSRHNILPGAFECTINDFDYFIAESNHHIHIKKITMDSRNNEALLDSIRCIPEFGKFEHARKLGYQSDRVSVDVEKAEIKGLDVLALLKGNVIASEVQIGKSRIYVFRDRRIKRKMDIKKLPDQQLQGMTNDVRIEKLSIPEAQLSYEEFPAEGVDSSGTMRFEKVSVTAQHVYNHPVNDSDFIDLKTGASLMGSGSMSSTTHIPLVPGKNYLVKGEIKNMDLSTLNASTVNLSLIRILSGKLNSLTFRYIMSHEKATGEIIGDYSNLRIEKLKLDSKNNKVKASFETFLQKTFVIPENRDKSVPIDKRTSKVDCQRDSTRFFTAYLTAALLSGVKNSFALGFLLPK